MKVLATILGLAAILMFSNGEPSSAAPQVGSPSCSPITAILSNGNCPGYETCALNLDAIFFGGSPDCSGCLWIGNATLTCDGSSIYTTPLNLSGPCSGPIQTQTIPCPSGDFGLLRFACGRCK